VSITIKAGDTIVWTNISDYVLHTVASGTRASQTGLFDRSLNPGEKFSYLFTDSGSYDYFCIPHYGMDGIVIVNG
jgi:plastocyanin